MVSFCFYFQVHQPWRLRKYSVFEIGQGNNYFDDKKNKEILNKVAKKCYIPTNKLMLKLIKKHPEFKISYSFSGTVLDQFEKYNPEVLNLFQQLVDTGNVEILDETYYHSLSFLYSKDEFKHQVQEHRNKVKKLFNVKPNIFRNTELIFNNELAKVVQDMGYKGIIAEGADRVLGWRSPNFLYTARTAPNIKLLLKNYKLSDDIAFRFSDKGWKEHPLTVPKFTKWANNVNGNGNCVNLFMDYETFGEHQWEDTGIFNFMENLPKELLKHNDNNFMTPSEVVDSYQPQAELDVHDVVSWADMERDVSAWLGNKMQLGAIEQLYQLQPKIMETNNKQLIEKWRKLQTSDHFYYMCTKWFNDGDVHKYFNPYENPYDAYITFMNIINDLKIRLKLEG